MAVTRVKVEEGILLGKPCGNPAVSVFKGVPYAAPPVGELRWREPQPASSWEGEREAFDFSAIAPQAPKPEGGFYRKEYFPVDYPNDEDCLYLNIWTPADTEGEQLPVFLWIHGGGFIEGYGHVMGYDGEAYAKNGIVAVTINYRVGILGFLADSRLSEESPHGVSGNYGLLDQIAAIHWVRRNIAAFGGDPDQVTIAGQSAGACSVQALISSPWLKGIVKGAILQSGAGICALWDEPLPTQEEAEERGDLQHVLQLNSIEEARALPWQEVLNRQIKNPLRSVQAFGPIVDGYVLPQDISATARDGNVLDIPCIIGCTSEEGLPLNQMTRKEYLDHVREIFGESAEEFLHLASVESEKDFLLFRAKLMQENLLAGTTAFCEARSRQRKAPSYLYTFTRRLPGDEIGAVHSAEHWYVFQTFLRCWRKMTAEDYTLSMRMSGYWMNFTKTGNPNGDGLPEWRPYTQEEPVRMMLGEEQKCVPVTLTPTQNFRKEFFLN